jgi:hypothetical protein
MTSNRLKADTNTRQLAPEAKQQLTAVDGPVNVVAEGAALLDRIGDGATGNAQRATSGPKNVNFKQDTLIEFNAYESVRASLANIDPEVLRAAEKTSSKNSLVRSFNIIKEWDGFVVSVGDSMFLARLTDLTSPSLPDSEEIEIPVSEIDASMRQQLAPGAFFRWTIGYEIRRGGQKVRASRILLRRLPAWRKSGLDLAKSSADQMFDAIKWE